MKGINIFLAPGFEDMEALATRDVLIRGGVPVNCISITDDYLVESSHGLQVTADTSWADLEVFHPGTDASDLMIFPGGMPGSKLLSQHGELMEIMKDHYALGGSLAAICAAPGLVLSQLDAAILEGKRFTCFDGFEDALIGKGAVYCPEGCVVDGRLITGRGAGWAIEFGLSIVEYLRGKETALQIRSSLML